MIMKKLTALIITAALLMSCSVVFADSGSQADMTVPESMKLFSENGRLELYNTRKHRGSSQGQKDRPCLAYNPPEQEYEPIAAAVNKTSEFHR